MKKPYIKCSFCSTSTPINSLDMRLIGGRILYACRKCRGIYDGKKPDGYYDSVFDGVRLDLSHIDRDSLPAMGDNNE